MGWGEGARIIHMIKKNIENVEGFCKSCNKRRRSTIYSLYNIFIMDIFCCVPAIKNALTDICNNVICILGTMYTVQYMQIDC